MALLTLMLCCFGFQYYRCVLLVPDIYNRQHIKEVVNLLLLNMGFSGITYIHVWYYTRQRQMLFFFFYLVLNLASVLFCVCSNHCAPGVSLCHLWQWLKQCLCSGCGRPEDQCLLCRGWSVSPKLQVSQPSYFIYLFAVSLISEYRFYVFIFPSSLWKNVYCL